MAYVVTYSKNTKVDCLVAETLEQAIAIQAVGRLQYPTLYDRDQSRICELREVQVSVVEIPVAVEQPVAVEEVA